MSTHGSKRLIDWQYCGGFYGLDLAWMCQMALKSANANAEPRKF